ncbi:MAG: hypothetical protein AB7N76_22800 [Planctomycetota bacterium]
MRSLRKAGAASLLLLALYAYGERARLDAWLALSCGACALTGVAAAAGKPRLPLERLGPFALVVGWALLLPLAAWLRPLQPLVLLAVAASCAWVEERGREGPDGGPSAAVSAHLGLWLGLAALGVLRLRDAHYGGVGPGWTHAPWVALLTCALLPGFGRGGRRLAALTLHSASLAGALLVLVELGAWTAPSKLAVTRYPYPYRGHGFVPEAKPAENRFSATTEAGGRRGPDLPRKPPGELRVLLLGGSTVLGDGSRDAQTPAECLQRLLDAELAARPRPGIARARVINGGQGWYVTTQELVYLVTELALLEPDVILCVDGYNDAHHSYVWGVRPPLNAVMASAYGAGAVDFAVHARRSWAQALNGLFQASWLLERLGVEHAEVLRSQRPRDGVAVIPQDFAGRPPEEQRALVQHRLLMNWTLIHRLSQGLGVRARFSLQPVIYLKERLVPAEAEFLERSSTRAYAGRMKDEWSRLEQAVEATRQRVGLVTFAADRYIRADPGQAFSDYCHLTPAANELLARSLLETVVGALGDWPWQANYAGIRYEAPVGDPRWRVGEGGAWR